MRHLMPFEAADIISKRKAQDAKLESERNQLYLKEVEPLIIQLKKKCKELEMPLVLAVKYCQGITGSGCCVDALDVNFKETRLDLLKAVSHALINDLMTETEALECLN